MFEYLSKYKRVLVTGPGRSGTRIATRMIAYDLGYAYLAEPLISVDSLLMARAICEQNEHFVLQCPSLMHCIHFFSPFPELAVVVMRRRVEDIVASQRRIGWSWQAWADLSRYPLTMMPEWPPLYPDAVAAGTLVSELKYEYWEEYQKHLLPHAYEVEYESLREHPLWVPPEGRRHFSWDQTGERGER